MNHRDADRRIGGQIRRTGNRATGRRLVAMAGFALAAGSTCAQTLDCMIQPDQVVQIGVPVAGVIESVAVERGDLVTRGQVVAQLSAGVERAALAVARERAVQQGELVMAESSQEFARRELERARELHERNFVSKTFLDKSRAEAEVAGGRSDQAQERRRLARREVDLAAAQLGQRTVRSPIDGVVVERHLAPGEFVDQKPIMRVASIDPLRVDVLVPAAAFGQVKVGAAARVTPELLDRRVHHARVKSVDRVVDAASNTFRVRLELPNPERTLPAGLRCKADLGIAATASAAAAAVGPAAPAPAGVTGAVVPSAGGSGQGTALAARTPAVGR